MRVLILVCNEPAGHHNPSHTLAEKPAPRGCNSKLGHADAVRQRRLQNRDHLPIHVIDLTWQTKSRRNRPAHLSEAWGAVVSFGRMSRAAVLDMRVKPPPSYVGCLTVLGQWHVPLVSLVSLSRVFPCDKLGQKSAIHAARNVVAREESRGRHACRH